MKVFLSHSSKDKTFVNQVAEVLRPGTYELDSVTFDAGLLNAQAILKSLGRCDLFCLFLSEHSVKSDYVNFETLLGTELIASGKIARFLAICLDDRAFDSAAANVKFFNIVRKKLTPESAARLIQGTQISIDGRYQSLEHPFVGREKEILELEEVTFDLSKPEIKGLFISGNHGSGRRTVARKFFQAHHPRVGRIIPEVSVKPFSGIHEIFRSILTTLRPSISGRELRARVQSFDLVDLDEQRRQTAELLNSLLPAHETTFLVDEGGLLTDAGAFTEEIDEIVSRLETRPHPPAIFIAP